jgi:hypothetical protein
MVICGFPETQVAVGVLSTGAVAALTISGPIRLKKIPAVMAETVCFFMKILLVSKPCLGDEPEKLLLQAS